MKKIVVSLLAVALVIVGCTGFTNGAKAAGTTYEEDTNGVRYVKYADMDYDTYFGQKAPEYDDVDADGVGFVFGGWYAEGDTYTAIKNEEELAVAKAGNTVVAKFVPAQTLSVKCQNWAGTDETSDGVIVRVMSAVDSTNYAGYGFTVSRIVDGAEKILGTHESDVVYSKFNYYKNAEDTKPAAIYEPDDLFGKAAEKFITCTVGKIPQSAHGTIICIKPFWKTVDGVTVQGLSRFAHVEDGYLNYVNVPVNLNILNAENGAVAGRLNVVSENGLKLVDVEYGKVFDEMLANPQTDSNGNVTVKCVGNMSDLSNKAIAMDIYINLRFQGISEADETLQHYTFTVNEEEFCDSDETIIQSNDVWNVKY